MPACRDPACWAEEVETLITMVELFRLGRVEEIWQRYCGFIDLSLQEFMEIQRELLMEQIDILSKSELGRTLMRGRIPKSIEEFRRAVPLTTYEDYRPFLARKQEEGLPQRTLYWMRTSGRSGEYPHKWVPVSEGMDRAWGISPLASVIFSACAGRGEFPLEEEDRFLYTLAPPPYASGHWSIGLKREFPFRFLPPLDEAEGMSFEDRILSGFRLALREGIDLFWGLSSVLVTVGERFSQYARHADLSRMNRHPQSLLRVSRGLLAARLERRSLLPRDLWRPKGIVSLGMDTSILRERVRHYWGRLPLEVYGATELGLVATQTWDYEGMTFAPDINFLEFLPEEERLRSLDDPKHPPKTVLLDEVAEGGRYEIVATNFRGGAFVRYRVGDLVEITGLRNERLDIDLPQMRFHSRADDVIDLGGFTRLTEKTIWEAIEESGIAYVDWVAAKEANGSGPVLRIYLEPADGRVEPEEAASQIHSALARLDADYEQVEKILGWTPAKVSLLAEGTFERYLEEQRAAGSDPAHLKPRHISPPADVLERLISSGSEE